MRFSVTLPSLAAVCIVASLCATSSAAEFKNDRDRVRQLANTVATGEWTERQEALGALVDEHGPFAVNGLLRWIGTNADIDAREKAVYAMRRLKGDAVLAMLAALHSDDAMVRRNLCLVLEVAGDARCVPALTTLAANDVDVIVRQMASAALAKLGGSAGDAASAWKQLAIHALGARPADDGANAVFFWNGKEVASRACTPEIYGPAYARLFAEEAIKLAPSDVDAQRSLLAAYAALLKAIEPLGPAPDAPAAAADEGSGDEVEEAGESESSEESEDSDEEMTEADGGNGQDDAGEGEGAEEEVEEVEVAPAVTLDEADALAWRSLQPLISDLLRLGGAMGPRAKGAAADIAVEPMAGATDLLRSPDKRYRYMAALSLARGGASQDVVTALADAIAEGSVRQVLVISDDPAEINELVAMIDTRERDAVGEKTGAMGIVRAKESPKDCVIIRTSVKDVPADHIVGILARDVRTKDCAVVLICTESERERIAGMFGDKVAAVLAAPVSKGMLEPALAAAFDKAKLNDERIAADDFAHKAAEALAKLDAQSLRPATSALIGAVGREDAVQVPALMALAKLGAPEAEGAALGVFLNASASADARVAAATALGGVLEENTGTAGSITALRGALDSADASLRGAAALALGGAKALSLADRSAMLLARAVKY
ncbi:MAG: HEAT repeat domain-containing protein [Planctomycetes bacterium]|nr:HEAT repeat domain-containing protein [Planctomycetota bacterium]MCC7171542.1 HEAT repeat domain-containing protein [Planctomycetota bacterium]